MAINHEAIFSIFSGNALVFLGAGFSCGACSRSLKDSTETAFPTGENLADELMEDLGETNTKRHPLSKCASFYEAKKTRSGLNERLAHRLEATQVQSFHKTILSFPWNRIYTTNYDDVLAKANSLPKRLRQIGLHDEIPHYTNSTIECLYINGYINIADPKNSNIVITDKDYANSNNTRREEMIRMFRTDVSIVKNVFFLGYSVYDIDIARILQEDTSIKKKIFFISGKEIDAIEEETLLNYGTVEKITCEEFALLLDNAKKEYDRMPFSDEKQFFSFDHYIVPSQNADDKSNKDFDDPVFSLISRSKINRRSLWETMKKKAKYGLVREKVAIVVESVVRGVRHVIVHSAMCNGKTIFLEELAIQLNEFYHVYFAKSNSSTLNRELIELSKQHEGEKIVVIIDGYAQAFREIFPITGRLENIYFILAERTPIHKMLLKNRNFFQNVEMYSLDQLSDTEILEFATLLCDNGITGLSVKKLSSEIVNDYGKTISKTILSILEESELSRRFMEQIKKDIENNSMYREEVYAIVFLSIILGEKIEKSKINEILNKRTAYTKDFVESSLFYNLLVHDEDYVHCPGIIPYIVAKKIFDPEYAREKMLLIAKYARNNNKNSFFERLSISTMRYSILQRVLPDQRFVQNTTLFYQELRTIGGLGGFPLFWLQFAIAKINNNEFELAKKYLESAYEMAQRTDFNVYQIDNQYAKLLLIADDTIPGTMFERFSQAKDLLIKQLYDSYDKHTYRAAAGIKTMSKHFNKFSKKELGSVKEFIEQIEKNESNLIDDEKREIFFDMKRILEAKVTVEKLLSC